MSEVDMEKQAAEDAFLRGYHDIPDDQALMGMSYPSLCTLLSQRKPESPAFMVIEAEKRRRDALHASERPDAKQDHATNPATDVANQPTHWTNKFLWPTAVGVIGTVIAAMLIYILKTHVGIPL